MEIFQTTHFHHNKWKHFSTTSYSNISNSVLWTYQKEKKNCENLQHKNIPFMILDPLIIFNEWIHMMQFIRLRYTEISTLPIEFMEFFSWFSYLNTRWTYNFHSHITNIQISMFTFWLEICAENWSMFSKKEKKSIPLLLS